MLIHNSIDLGLCLHIRPRKQGKEGLLFRGPDPYRISPVGNSWAHDGNLRLAHCNVRRHGNRRRPPV